MISIILNIGVTPFGANDVIKGLGQKFGALIIESNLTKPNHNQWVVFFYFRLKDFMWFYSWIQEHLNGSIGVVREVVCNFNKLTCTVTWMICRKFNKNCCILLFALIQKVQTNNLY